MPPDETRPGKKFPRAQSSTERDIASPHLGMKNITAQVQSLADDEDSDGTPSTACGPDQEITPAPQDVRNDPQLFKLWQHANRRYEASVNHMTECAAAMGATEDVRHAIKSLQENAAEAKSQARVLKVLGSLGLAFIAIVGGIAIKSIYGTGVDSGTVTTSLQYMQRDIINNADAIKEGNADLRVRIRDLEQQLDEHQRSHGSRGSRSNPSPAAPSAPAGDTP